MDFGVFNIMQQRNPAKSAKQIFDEAAEQTVVAEQLGFAKSWYAEHHFSNYSLCPSPLMMCAHMAGRTNRIRLGTAVVVAPLYTPARLLAEIGMVDTLSNGRLDLGIGLGYQRYEFERFGVGLEHSWEMTNEIFDLIDLGLSAPSFEYDGKYFHQPRSAISCKPVQKPTPPIWFAGGNEDHLRRIARNDRGLLISGGIGGVGRLQQMRENYERIALEEGKDPQTLKIAVGRLAFPTKSKKDAEHFVDCARYQQRLAVALRRRQEKVANDYIVQEAPFDDEPSFETIASSLPVGDVDTCIERLVRMLRDLKPVHLFIQSQVGDMEHSKSLQALELWMTEVIPAALRELGHESAAA